MGVDRPYAATGNLVARGVEKSSGTTFPATVSGFNPTAPNCAPPNSFWNGSACRFDYVSFIDLVPENDQLSTLLRGSMKFGDHIVAAEYLRAENNTKNRVSPTPMVGMNIPSTSPFYPAGATGNIVNWRTTDAGKRSDSNEAVADRILLEANGLVAGWDYRTGLWQSNNEVTTEFYDGYLNSDAIQAGLTAGLLNPFGPQTAAGTQALQSAKILGQVLSAEGKSTGFDARVSKDMFQMAGGASALAMGSSGARKSSSTTWSRAAPARRPRRASNSPPTSTVTATSTPCSPRWRSRSRRRSRARWRCATTTTATSAERSTRRSPCAGSRRRACCSAARSTPGFRAPTLYDIYQPVALTYTSDSYDDPTPLPGRHSGRRRAGGRGVRTAGAAAPVGPRRHRQAGRLARAGEVDDVQRGLRVRADERTDVRPRLLQHHDQEPDQQHARADHLRRPDEVRQLDPSLRPAVRGRARQDRRLRELLADARPDRLHRHADPEPGRREDERLRRQLRVSLPDDVVRSLRHLAGWHVHPQVRVPARRRRAVHRGRRPLHRQRAGVPLAAPADGHLGSGSVAGDARAELQDRLHGPGSRSTRSGTTSSGTRRSRGRASRT